MTTWFVWTWTIVVDVTMASGQKKKKKKTVVALLGVRDVCVIGRVIIIIIIGFGW